MNRPDVWGWVLIVAALVSLVLQFMHWRRGRITTAQAVSAMIARGGFLVLGVIYVSSIIIRYPRAPLAGLALVGIGIFLHLAVNTYYRIRGTG